MQIYLIRHAETDANLTKHAQGSTDNPLNDTGRAQALALKPKLRNIPYTKVYSSPLSRSLNTAKLALGENAEILIDEDLRECDFGELEGADSSDWTPENLLLRLQKGENGVETLDSLLYRAQTFLARIKAENAPDAIILVFSHSVFMHALHFCLTGLKSPEELLGVDFPNASLKSYIIN